MTGTVHVDVHNATVAADAACALHDLLAAAHAHGLHLGLWEPLHASLGDAIRQGDPCVLNRVQRVVRRSPDGVIHGPVAPRAAVGPDLRVFAQVRGAQLGEVRLRADTVVEVADGVFRDMEHAVNAAAVLAERGATLVEVRDSVDGGQATLRAALPRPGLAGAGLQSRPAPPWPAPAAPPRTQWCAVTGWGRARQALDALCRLDDARGCVRLHVLDARWCVVRVAFPPDRPPWPMGMATRISERLGRPARPLPEDLTAALAAEVPGA